MADLDELALAMPQTAKEVSDDGRPSYLVHGKRYCLHRSRRPDAVQPDKSFTDDLDIDSLSMMTIVVNAEEKFGVRIPDDDVKNLKTVGDAVSYIQSAQS